MKRFINLSIALSVCLAAGSTFAIEVTEPAGAEHGYPALCDGNGRKLANGEFRQWLRGDRLHVVISYPLIRVDLVSVTVGGPSERVKEPNARIRIVEALAAASACLLWFSV